MTIKMQKDRAQHVYKARVLDKRKIYAVLQNYDLYLMLVPVMAYYIIFSYLPMFGVTVAFKDYNIFEGMLSSPWAGLKWFQKMFGLPDFYNMVRNTLGLNILSLVFGFPAPIILALMINEVISTKLKRTVQSILYLPHFMSWVVLAGIIYNMLSPQYGYVSGILRAFGMQPVFFMGSEFWWIVVFIISGIWQSAGWGTIVYFAALTGIDPALYEAAVIDGANKWKQIIHITIPCLLPTIVTMLILRMGSLVSMGYEHPMALYNPVVSKVAQVVSTYVYYAGIENAQYSLTTALGLLQSVINTVLIILTNKISKKLGQDGIF